MLSVANIREIANSLGVNEHIIEQDYVLMHILNTILQDEILKENLIFKGGNAISKIYLDNTRFSSDLDFTTLEKLDFEEAIREVCYTLSVFDLRIAKLKIKYNILFAELRYKGPLQKREKIEINISWKEKTILKPIKKEIHHIYPDISREKVYTLDIQEIISEKMRALYMRKASRDFFDLWLLSKSYIINFELVARILIQKLSVHKLTFEKSILENSFNDVNFDKLLKWIPQKYRNFKADEIIKTVKEILKRIADVIDAIQ